MPDDASYLSRFTVKFVEITAAGVATAISGYAIAHVAGYFSQPAPVVIQPVPAISAVAKPPARNVLSARPVPARVEAKGETKAEGKGESKGESRAEAKAEPKVEAKTEPKSEPKSEAKSEAKAEPKTEPKTEPKAEAKAEPPQQAANPAPSQSAKAAATATQAPQRKPVTAEATATESKPRDTLSVEAEVRAALAKVDASRPAHADSRPEQAAPVPVVREVQPLQQEAQPLPVDDTVGTVAAVPRGPEAIPETAKQVLAPPDAPPLDIKSLPVATVEAAPPAAPDEPAPKKSGGGIFSVIKNFPDMLRSDGHEPSRDAPRPPMPVGE